MTMIVFALMYVIVSDKSRLSLFILLVVSGYELLKEIEKRSKNAKRKIKSNKKVRS
ncbi:hypothetical protein [Ileibacterium valens]|uniref:hypothetical protein n=1 Tax=Ileibacterium valens TaxID=1862668 RepID=UPI002730EE51|nr:hypothetical protein [Ileibacterium valens]